MSNGKFSKPNAQQQVEAAAQARNAFARDMADGRVGVIDRFGNHITKGALVMCEMEITPVFEIIDVAPILDPRMPPGIARVVLAVQMPVQIPVGQRTMNMCVIGQVVMNPETNQKSNILTGPQMHVASQQEQQQAQDAQDTQETHDGEATGTGEGASTDAGAATPAADEPAGG